MIELRWYKHTNYSWKWDSRNEEYCKSALKQDFVLQYKNSKGVWTTVPFVETEYTPPEPKK